MATSGYGNRLAGGNQFFQRPKGAWLALGTRGAPRRILRVLTEAQRPSPTWNYRLPRLPPATLRWAGPQTQQPRPLLKHPPHPSC